MSIFRRKTIAEKTLEREQKREAYEKQAALWSFNCKKTVTCDKCGWSGAGRSTKITRWFGQALDYYWSYLSQVGDAKVDETLHCPICGHGIDKMTEVTS